MFLASRKRKIPASYPGVLPGTVVLISSHNGWIHARVQPIEELRSVEPQLYVAPGSPDDPDGDRFQVIWKGLRISPKGLTAKEANNFALKWVKQNLIQQSASASHRSSSWGSRLLLVSVGVLAGILISLPQEPLIGVSAAPAVSDQTRSAAPALAQDIEDEIVFSARTFGHLTQGVQILGIPLREATSGSRPLYVFADPQCPHCQRLEKELYQLPDDIQPIIIAAPILGDRSFNRVAQIYEGEDPQVWKERWKKAMAMPTLPIDSQADSLSESRSKVAQALFFAMDLESTPTLVSHDGRAISGARSSQEIEAWLRSKSF